MEVQVRQHEPPLKSRMSPLKQLKPKTLIPDVVPTTYLHQLPMTPGSRINFDSKFDRQRSIESSSNDYQSMNVSPSPPSPSSSRLQSPLTVNSASYPDNLAAETAQREQSQVEPVELERQMTSSSRGKQNIATYRSDGGEKLSSGVVLLDSQLISSDSHQNLSSSHQIQSNSHQISSDGRLQSSSGPTQSSSHQILSNSHQIPSNSHSQSLDYHEDDPLYIHPESQSLLPSHIPPVSSAPPLPPSVTPFKSTSDRRNTEPKSLTRSNSFKPKTMLRHSTFPTVSSSSVPLVDNVIHFNDPNNNPLADEARRLRSSIISRREVKKKRKVFLEDEKVLVGNKVGEGHSNYVMLYNMLTGIRVSVSRCSGVRAQLTDLDFSLTKKLAFDVSGSELTPSSKYDFKFKDYAPEVFRELRMSFGLDPLDYLVSLTSKYILSELGSPGKSGSFFYYSRDYRFIIKTIHHREHRQLRAVLKDYYHHVKDNPNTLISQFYGLHRLKMRVNGRHRKIHFLVMNNLFPAKSEITRQYDLKGSTDGRYTRAEQVSALKGRTVVYKDLNWLEDGYDLRLKSSDKAKLVLQLKKDVQLLQRLNIMDYSMLIGVHDCHKTGLDHVAGGANGAGKRSSTQRVSVSYSAPDRNSISTFTVPKKLLDVGPSTSSATLERLQQQHEENRCRDVDLDQEEHLDAEEEFEDAEDGFYQFLKSENGEFIYYFGVIDCLTRYSTMKRLETLMRKLNHSKNFSCINAKDYGDRFLNFMQKNVFKKDKAD